MAANETIQSATDELTISVFLAAMSRPEGERTAFVREACAGNALLLVQVERRVNWEQKLGGFLLTPVVPRERFDQTFAVGETVLNRFQILRVAGEGGMGIVYEAFDGKLDRRIALKAPRFEFRKRLSPEASKSLQVTHPNVCRVFEIHTEATGIGEVDFLTMEFLEGETMATRLQHSPQNWLTSAEGTEIAHQICAGLKAIHEQGIVHRDLKPGNVMLSHSGSGHPRAVIMDFGIAQSSDIFSSHARGTPAYLAPEIWRGQPATIQSDIYALGVLLYEMACGHKPFPEETEWKERFASPPLPPDIREPARSALLRCLHPDPTYRLQSVDQLESALWKPPSRRLLLAASLLGLVASGVLGTVWKERYWPSPVVRLAVLPLSETKQLTGETRALLNGFIQDISSRLKSMRGARRPFIVIPIALMTDVGITSSKGAQDMLSATHALSTEFKRVNQGWSITVQMKEISSGKELQRWSQETSLAGLSAGLFEMQSKVIEQTTQQLGLQSLPPHNPLNTEAYSEYLQGLYYARVDYENVANAIPFFERVIALAPDSALGYAGLAEALFGARGTLHDKSMEARAAAALAKAENRDPDSAHVHFIAGRLAAAGGSWERALVEFRRASQLEPNDAEAFISLGYVHYMLNQPQLAEASFLRAVAVQPQYYKTHLDTGLFYYEERNFNLAEKYWMESVRLGPNQTRARINLVVIYLATNRLVEAWPRIEESLKIKRTRPALEVLADWQERSGRYAEAVATYEEALRSSSYYKTWAGLGNLYRRVGREADAVVAFRKGLERTEEGLRANRREAESIAWASYYHAKLLEEPQARSLALEARTISSPPSYTVKKRLVLVYDLIRDIEAALPLLENVPRDLITELVNSGELSPRLLHDPRFVRLI